MTNVVDGKAVAIMAGNVINDRTLAGQGRDVFPTASFGGRAMPAAGNLINAELDTVGMFATGLAADNRALRVRAKGAIETFYENNNAKDGTRLFFQKTGLRDFRVSAIA